MKVFFIIPLLLAFSCKANNENTVGNDFTKMEKGKDPDPVMGGPTSLTITLSDVVGGGTAKIYGFYLDQNYLADTVLFNNGVIKYENKKGLAQGLYYIGVTGRKEYIQVFLGKDQEFEMSLAMSDIPNTMKVSGSDENQIFYDNMKYESGINPRINELSSKMKTLTEASPDYAALKKEREQLDGQRLKTIADLRAKYPDLLYPSYKYGGQNPKLREDLNKDLQVVQYRNDFWQNVDFQDRRLLRTPMIGNKIKRYMKELTAQNHDSILISAHYLMNKVLDKPEYYKVFANWIVLTFEPAKCNLMDAESVFVGMVQKYFTHERAFWSDSLQTSTIQKRAVEMSLSLIGKKGPNVISTDQFGKKQELYNKTADYLIVYMFNPECEHCMEETPKLAKFYNENKDKGIDVFAIAIDTDDSKWKAYITKNNLTWTNVYDPSNRSIYGKYFVDVTPEMYVLNKERTIIGKNLKTEQLPIIIERDKANRKS